MSILEALVAYAHERQLSLNTEEQKITYKLTLGKDASPKLDFLGEVLRVPRVLKDRSAGIEPRQGSDTVKYVLTPGKHFDAFWDLIEATIPTRGRTTVQAFRKKKWNIESQVKALTKVHKDLTFDGSECVAIVVHGIKGYLHDLPEFEPSPDLVDDKTECMVTGKLCSPMRLHPSVKGVVNTQKGRVPLISYNDRVYEFEGRKQGNNCPVSPEVAVAYTSALSDMLSMGDPTNGRRRKNAVQLPDDRMLVMWSSANLDPIFDVLTAYPTKITPKAVEETWQRFDEMPSSDAIVHVLILEGDSGRISILRWEDFSFNQILQNLRDFREDFQHATQAPSLLTLMSGLEADFQLLDNVTKSRAYEAVLLGEPLPRVLYQFAIDRILGLAEPQSHDRTWFNNMATKVAWANSYRRRKGMTAHTPPIENKADGLPNEADYFPQNADPAFHEGRWLALVEALQFKYARRRGGFVKVNNPLGMRLREFSTNTRRIKSEIQSYYLPLYLNAGLPGKKVLYCIATLNAIQLLLVNHTTPRRANREQELQIGNGYYSQRLYLQHFGVTRRADDEDNDGDEEASASDVDAAE